MFFGKPQGIYKLGQWNESQISLLLILANVRFGVRLKMDGKTPAKLINFKEMTE